jgi:hypothetical protein
MSRASKGMDKRLAKMKHEIPPASSPPQRVLPHVGGGTPLAKEPLAKPKPKVAPWPVTLASGPPPGRRRKKILLGFMVAASICVVTSFALFTIKPSWLAELKGRLPLIGAPTNKRSSARYPSRPVFKVVQPRRTNSLPPSTPPMMAEQMERPQAFPSGISPSTPPSAYPVARPPVSTPGTPGMPPAVPRASTYRGTRPDLSVPGAPGIAPSMSPPSTYPGARPDVAVPEGVQRPPSITSSLPPKKEESESDEYLEIATLYAQKGKYQKAEELFQKVAKENPASAKAHNNLGVVRLKQEKYDMAEREFKEAMRIDPAFVLPYYNLACLYSRKGVDVDALIYLKRALKRDERVKQWVKTDKDFDRLRNDSVFQEVLGGSPTKKEGTSKKEETQKREGAQRQDGVRQPEGAQKKKEDTLKPETQTQEKAPHMGLQKKEEIPPQSGPPQQVIPRQEEIQKQETPPAGAQSQSPSQGDAPNQERTKGGAQNQLSAPGAQGGTAQ